MLRFLYCLIALALVFSPLGMSGAMAHAPETSMAEGHCSESQGPADQDKGSKAMLDCMGICSAIPVGEEPVVFPDALPASAVQARVLAAMNSLDPESELPPPRVSRKT